MKPRRRRWGWLRSLTVASALLLPSVLMAQGPIQPASYGYPGAPVYGGPQYPAYGPGCNTCGPGGLSPNTVYELLPEDRFSHGDELHWAAFSSAFKHAYLRLEYLNWSIEDPGIKNVGASRLSGDERGTFTAINPNTDSNVGQGEISTLDHIALNSNNGIRGVFGLPTRIGLFEAGVSALQQADAYDVKVPFFNSLTFENIIPVVPLLEDGALSDTKMILFSEGLSTRVKSQLFTTELNYILNPLTPNQPVTIRPLFGFQYVRFWDSLDVRGTDIADSNTPDDPTDDIILNHRLYSSAKNNVFAPQIGFRAEFEHERFSVGVTPKFMIGFNRHRNEVLSEQLFSPTEAQMSTHDENSEFAPGLDLAVHGKVHLNEHLSLFVSYQLFYISNLSRGYDNIVYDSIGTDPNLRLGDSQEATFVDGLTVGGEYRFH
ncbi:MAG: BBP7 family outer membrane beta-barrel protein [Planctomycetaceae bacterium]